ncbi:MAG: flagellar biosynthetic protein FliO, partial [Desulfobacula sp.]|nr:flagellar biosynthetic protein FliO [Desulfobacula sp.]
LAVTVGAIVFASYLFKKIMNKSGVKINDSELIKILSVKYLGPKNSIMLINVSEHMMVIGVTSSKISLLTEIVDSESLEQLKGIQDNQGKSAPFSDYLKGLLKGAGS